MSDKSRATFHPFFPTPQRRKFKKTLDRLIPDDYVDCTLDKIKGEEGERIRNWFAWYCQDAPYEKTDKKRKASLWLRGKFGYGKTGAAVAVARQFLIHGASIGFENELFLAKAFDDQERWDRAMNSWLFVLDDVGSAKNEDFGRRWERLESVVRYRKDANLPTIVTTNLSMEETKQTCAAIISIISGYYTVVNFEGHNWRKEESKRTVFHG